MNIKEIREKYPTYNDMSDESLAEAFHQKYYSDMDLGDFKERIGLQRERRDPIGDTSLPLSHTGGRLGAVREPQEDDMPLPSMGELFGAAKRSPVTTLELTGEIIAGTGAYAGGIGTKIMAETAPYLPNMGYAGITGGLGYLKALQEDMTHEEREEFTTDLEHRTMEMIRKIFYAGVPPESQTPETETLMKGLEAVMEAPTEHAFEPLGEAYGRLVGDPSAGRLMSDVAEASFWFAVTPWAARKTGHLRDRAKKQIDQAKRDRQKLEAEEQRLRREKVEAELERGEALTDVEIREQRARDYKERADEIFGQDAIADAETALQQRDRIEAAQDMRVRELDSRQKYYEDLFSEQNVGELLTEIETFIENKPRFSRTELDRTVAQWEQRMRERDLELAKDWRNWRDEKLLLDRDGVRPAKDVFDLLQVEMGRPGKGLPPGASDLRFGVEAKRPWPRDKTQAESGVIETPQRRELSQMRIYSPDSSIARKMRPGGGARTPKKPTSSQQLEAISEMGQTILGTPEAQRWIHSLDPSDIRAVSDVAMDYLRVKGVKDPQAIATQDVHTISGRVRKRDPELFTDPDFSRAVLNRHQGVRPPSRPLQRQEVIASLEQFPESQRQALKREELANKKMEADALARREEMIRQAAEERQARKAAEREHGETAASREFKSELEKRQAELTELRRQELEQSPEYRAARELDEYHGVQQETPRPDSAFSDSLMFPDEVSLFDVIEDLWYLSDERGAIGKLPERKLTAQQQQAARRLSRNMEIIKRNAARVGKKISEYLLDARFTTDPAVAQAIETAANKNSPDLLTELPGQRTRKAPSEGSQTVRASGDPLKNAHEVAAQYKRARQAELREKAWKTPKEMKETLGRWFLSTNTKARQALENMRIPKSREVLDNLVLAKGAGVWAKEYFNAAYDNIYGHLSRTEKRVLDEVINAKRKVQIHDTPAGRGRTYPENFDIKFYQDFIAADRQGIPNWQRAYGLSDAQRKKIEQSSTDYFNTMRDLLQKKYQEGAIPDWLYDILQQYDYSPTMKLEIMDRAAALYARHSDMDIRRPPKDLEQLQRMSDNVLKRDPEAMKHDLNIRDTNIKRLKQGSAGYERMKSDHLLAQLSGETFNWSARNRATRSLAELARDWPNDIIKLPEVIRYRKGKHGDVTPVYANPAKGEKALHYFADGQKHTLHVPDWFAKDWTMTSHAGQSKMATVARAASLSGWLRATHTGWLNPLFFIKSFPMDVMHIYQTGMVLDSKGQRRYVYGSNPLKFTKEFAQDLRDVARDAWKQEGRYLEYLEDGGGHDFMTRKVNPGDPIVRSKAGRKFHGLQKYMAHLNISAEVMARLAMRERLMKQGYDRRAASAAARDRLDYGQGGEVAKALDQGIPYLNVAFQALRTTGRAAVTDPKGFGTRAMHTMAAASAIHYIGRSLYQDAVDGVSDWTKDNFFILPTGRTITDEEGNEMHLSVKIRKEPSTRLITTLAETMTSAAMGDYDEFTRLLTSLKSSVPLTESLPLPPTLAAILTYATNTDMFTLQRIHHQRGQIEPGDEWYHERTSQLYKDLVGWMGVSPERFRASMDAVLGRNNIFRQMIGEGYDSMFREIPKEDHDNIMAEIFLKGYGNQAFTLTSPYAQYREVEEGTMKERAAEIEVQNRRHDSLAKDYFLRDNDRTDFEAISNFIEAEEIPEYDKKRLWDRFERYGKISQLLDSNVRRWTTLSRQEPIARAKNIHRWFSKMDEESRMKARNQLEALAAETDLFPQDDDSKFWQEFYRLEFQRD